MSKMMILELPVSSIDVPEDRARDYDEGWAQMLAVVIAVQGLHHPIRVRQNGDRYTLISGRHRLQAFELNQSASIPATVSTAETDDDARMEEVMENLARNELTALDRCHHLYELKVVWDRMHPDFANGGGNQRGRNGGTSRSTDAALERYHKESVMVGYDYHQADKVWVREFDVKTGQPGKLICVAGFMANAQRYVPVTFEQQALETRAKTRLKRIEGKATAIEAELNAPYLIDQDAVEISGELFDLQPQEPVVAERQVAPDSVKNIADTQPRRQVFASDEELAAWALNHPDELLPNQITVLRRCMNNSTARELFRMQGIDTEALRNLLRAVA